MERRLAVHNSGKGAKYTRSRLPAVLVYQEEASDKSAALRREATIKKLSRAEKLRLIAAGQMENGPEPYSSGPFKATEKNAD